MLLPLSHNLTMWSENDPALHLCWQGDMGGCTAFAIHAASYYVTGLLIAAALVVCCIVLLLHLMVICNALEHFLG